MGALTKRHEWGTIKLLIVWQLAAIVVWVRLKPNHALPSWPISPKVAVTVAHRFCELFLGGQECPHHTTFL